MECSAIDSPPSREASSDNGEYSQRFWSHDDTLIKFILGCYRAVENFIQHGVDDMRGYDQGTTGAILSHRLLRCGVRLEPRHLTYSLTTIEALQHL